MIRRIILAYCILTTFTVAGQDTTYGLVGGTVTLKTNIKDTPDEILWKHKGNKVVEVDGQEQSVFGSFSDRITLNRSSADLRITDLSYEDSGEYVLETYNKGLTRSNYKLEVIDKVAKPTISCKMNTDSSSSTSANQATLMCSSEPGQFQSLMKFEWSSHEKSGQNVTISLGDEHDDKVYTCTVSNPLSKEWTTFTPKDCYNGDSAVAIVTGITFAIAFAILLLMALLFCKLKNKACFAKGNYEKRASYGETEETRNMLPKDDADEHKEDANSHQVTGETQEKIDHTPQRPVQEVKKVFEPKPGEQKPAVSGKRPLTPSRNDKEDTDTKSDKKTNEDEERIAASANAPPVVQPLSEDGEHKEDANPDQVSDKTTTKKNAEESDPSGNRLEEETTSPEQKGAEATVHETNSKQTDVETHSREDNQQDNEHNEIRKNLSLENSQQPQSPITPEPDHINTNTCQESSDTEQAASDLEEKEINRDSGSGTKETDEEPLNVIPKDDADKHKEDANSHQVTGETQEKIDHTPQRPVQEVKKVFEPKPGEQKPPESKVQRSESVRQKVERFEKESGQQKEGSTPGNKKSNIRLHQAVSGEPKKPSTPSRNDKENTDVTQDRESTENKISECDPADPEKTDVVLSGGLNDDKSYKKTDEDVGTMTASANAPPVVQPLSEDDEHKEDANPDQVSDKTSTKKNAEESDPSGNRLEKETTSPEQKDAEATVHEPNSTQAEVETHSGEDNKQDSEHNETVKNLPLENSQQPQSPITPETDHNTTNTCQESSHTEQAASDLDDKENNRDSGNGTEETNKESKVQRSESVRQKVERFEKESGQQKEGSTPGNKKSNIRLHQAVSGEPKKPSTPSRNDKENTDVTQDRDSTENKVSECDPADPEKADVVLPGALNNDKPSGLPEGNECNRLEEETSSPEQKGAEATVNEPNSKQAHVETHSGEDNQQDRHKKVSNNEPAVDKENNETGNNLPLENPQQPQSPITPGPDHINTNTCQESSHTEQAASDLGERENNCDSDSRQEETDGGEAVGKNKVQHEPEDGKSDNESFSGDKEV